MFKNKLTNSDVYVEEQNGLLKLFLNEASTAIARFDSGNQSKTGKTQYLAPQDDFSMTLAHR